MVADSSDDKVLAVLPGGVFGRFFHLHAKDQIKAFISGEKVYWWLSDKAIRTHKQDVPYFEAPIDHLAWEKRDSVCRRGLI